ncbi:hypothetical protein Droror1_Dr00005484 [Drosera rotundifolia]
MAQTLNLSSTILSNPIPNPRRTHRILSSQSLPLTLNHSHHHRRRLHFNNGRITCLFSDNRKKQEQVKKALENALGGKKEQFENWNTEIKKKEERDGGNKAGGGSGWFGGGGRFGWSSDDHFWEEAQQTSLTILAILSVFLLVVKGDTIFAAVVNPLLFSLRRIRETFSYVSFRIGRLINGENSARVDVSPVTVSKPSSARERVLKKWGSD